MALPVSPPLEPMLATLARELPRGDYVYEPKWDGFRCLAFVDGGSVDLRSRNQRPLARYFPEVCGALAGIDAVLDGELVIASREGFDFAALMARLHPSKSRVELLARTTPATFIAFDLLAVGGRDLRAEPFHVRRSALERLIPSARPGLQCTPSTRDPALAERWLSEFSGAGVDGVIAKPSTVPYLAGKRAMVKVKTLHSIECVVAGLRLHLERPVVASLLLGVYEDGVLRHVGVSSSFTEQRRRELLEELRPYACDLRGHPWEHGFGLGPNPMGRLAGSASRWIPDQMELDWTPLRAERVCEVAYDQLDTFRFRHPAKFLRWRPDRDAASCELAQLRRAGVSGGEVLVRGTAP